VIEIQVASLTGTNILGKILAILLFLKCGEQAEARKSPEKSSRETKESE